MGGSVRNPLGRIAFGVWPVVSIFVLGLYARAQDHAHVRAAPAPRAAPQRDAETARMVERLAQISKDAVAEVIPYLNDRRARKIVSMFKPDLPLPQALSLQLQLATELIRAGYNERAIHAFGRLERMHLLNNLAVDRTRLRNNLATVYLRLGEQENCLRNHSAASCLLPIAEEGRHRIERGSRGAMQVLSEQLSENPDDLASVWLYNIAAMTLGEYPEGVEENWRIAEDVFRSEAKVKRFRDVALAAGVDVNQLSGGSVAEDFDNDGFLDLLVSSWGLDDQIRFFRNLGNGRFEDRTHAAGLTGLTGGLNMVQADYDNDGFVDVLVLRGAWLRSEGGIPNSLLRNNGDGTFSDVSESSGTLSFHPTQTAVWFDYDNDGHLDLFIGNESDAKSKNPCELFRNNGDGTFRECAAALGLHKPGFVKGVAAGDFNNDGLTDLYLSRLGQTNILWQNNGPLNAARPDPLAWDFSDVTFSARVYEPIKSFPTWFWDYDNDGRLDLFVADYGADDVAEVAADYLGKRHSAERARLFRNKGNGSFEDVSREAGLRRVFVAMGSNFGDVDNDGYLDLYLGTGTPDMRMLIPNRLMRNDRGKRFQDVTTSAGVGHLQKGHGVSFADLDNDGDQDIYQVMGGAFSGDIYPNVLFENPGYGAHWVTLSLRGTKTNRMGIGARIKLTVGDGKTSRQIHRVVGSGGSFGCSPLRQEIGLGRAALITSLQVTWPVSGRTSVFKNVAADAFYRIEEGKTELKKLERASFRFPSASMH